MIEKRSTDVTDDIDYYRYRATVELGQARRATTSIAILIHHELASAYLGRVAELEQASTAPLSIDAAAPAIPDDPDLVLFKLDAADDAQFNVVSDCLGRLESIASLVAPFRSRGRE